MRGDLNPGMILTHRALRHSRHLTRVRVTADRVPLLFLVVLLRCRESILRGRATLLVQSTAFLHREYEKQLYGWEVLFLSQRMFVVGCVQAVGKTMHDTI
jgi:hypothetical protein